MEASGFDRIARAYRWLEYCSLGRSLERCRAAQLARFGGARRVLVLGDGDGRFTASLLARHRQLQVVTVDSSAVMLALLASRVRAIGACSRLTVVHREAVALFGNDADLLPLESKGQPTGVSGANPLQNGAPGPEQGFDYVCSHFFLDCLSTAEVDRLVGGVCLRLRPGAQWIISEFAEPSWWARLVVAVLYRAFRVLAGLRTQHLPQWRQALMTHHFAPVSEQRRLGGLLTSSVWLWRGCTPEGQGSGRLDSA